MLMTAADFTRRFFSSDSSFDSLLPVLLWEKSGWGERAQVNTGSLAIQNELCHCFPCCRCIEDAPTAVACNWPAQVRLLTAYPPPACPQFTCLVQSRSKRHFVVIPLMGMQLVAMLALGRIWISSNAIHGCGNELNNCCTRGDRRRSDYRISILTSRTGTNSGRMQQQHCTHGTSDL